MLLCLVCFFQKFSGIDQLRMNLKDRFSSKEIRQVPLFKFLGLVMILALAAFLVCRIFLRQLVSGMNLLIWLAVFIALSVTGTVSLWKIGNRRSAVVSGFTTGILLLISVVYYILFMLHP